ncbi:hypothetical protein [Aquimarina sp. 2201CG5-10]|uniref:hypothetical protein n=1 Tax=Aquimarina callyspongiae TaxID=3098150 RepID=UPI002AB3BD54|nr:hypothetical protein [Aquimarina sp. 2201CG5-10]MDY8134469.1 hypothetical protein [Aquimarina sp. 2201CG5-10]
MRILLNTILCVAILTSIVSCSNDDDNATPIDDRNFTTNAETDFFINRDGTVNLTISGSFKDGNSSFGSVLSRGFVYGTTSNTEVNANNTVVAAGPQDMLTGAIQNLPSGQTYFIRGYFEMSDNTYFYGNEIQASTNVNASTIRTLVMEMEPTPFFVSSTEITPQINVTEIQKESPTEIGFEYSLNNDFSNSTILLYTGPAQNIRITSYQEVISGLTSSTTYHIRPYAKYADGTITNGGTSTVSITTN